MILVQPFPKPGHLIEQAFLDQVEVGWLRTQLGGKNDDDVQAKLETFGSLDTLPRPWLPETCSATVRGELWVWIEQAVAWLNHEYGWSVDRTVPACWPQHPHLIRELAVLISLRWQADNTHSPTALEDWHRYSLPMFLDRMRAQIGSGCQPGKHTPWPALPRYEQYLSDAPRGYRSERFRADTEQVHHARPRLDVVAPS